MTFQESECFSRIFVVSKNVSFSQSESDDRRHFLTSMTHAQHKHVFAISTLEIKMADGTCNLSEPQVDYGQTTNSVSYETNKRALETDREDYVNAKRANFNGMSKIQGAKFAHFSALLPDSSRPDVFQFSRVHS